MTISQIDKRVERLCELADNYYDQPEKRDEIQRQVDELMDERDRLVQEAKVFA